MTRSILNLGAACVIAAASTGFGGCSGQANQPPAATNHAGHDHEHGHHDHPEVGPHKGDLVELGKEEYHAELVHDDASHRVTIYLLDAHVKNSVSIPAEPGGITLNLIVGGKPAQYPFVPVAASGGQASQFELVDESACDALCGKDDAKARLSVTIQGKSFVGAVAHHSHAGHDHAHGSK